MPSTEDKSSLTLSLCLIWETERPYENKPRRSPCFTYMNCEWYLELKIALSSFSNEYLFFLIMVRTKELKSTPEFMVRTYYKNQRYCVFHQECKVAKTSDCISSVRLSEVENTICKFKIQGTLTIVCVFDDAVEYTQLFGSEGPPTIHFPPKEESPLDSKASPVCSTSTAENHPYGLENLSKDLEALLDNKVLPDVQLIVEETSIPCHKAVLVARSKVFAAMFQHDMTESTSGVLKIKDIDLSAAEAFLKYLYSGKIPDDLTEDMLVKLFEIGDKYDVNALKRESSKKLTNYINEKNCLSYLSLAEVHSDQEFKEAVVCYIVKEDKLMKSEDWMHFSAENPKLGVEVYRKYVAKLEMKSR